MPANAPAPFQIGRFHSEQVNALCLSPDNERIYSADGTGRVVCTSTRTFRVIVAWQAHEQGVLTIAEWNSKIITHGRDNKIHVWKPITTVPVLIDTAVASSSTPVTPTLLYSLDVNALNFCKFSLSALPPTIRRAGEEEVFIAVPHLADSGLCDIWALPSLARIHGAVGKIQAQAQAVAKGNTLQPDGRGGGETGIIMALHLFWHPLPDKPKPQLRLLCAYEAGHVSLFARTDTYLDRSFEGKSWELLWSVKGHVESVMGLAVSPDNAFALSVSADHLIVKYILSDILPDGVERTTIARTKWPGNAAISIRSDGRVCAVAGWDGKIRLYSTKSFKSLGTLEYHSESAYAVVFANSPSVSSSSSSSAPSSSSTAPSHPQSNDAPKEEDQEGEDDDDDWDPSDSARRERWLVSAGKEGRLAFWELDSFERGKR